MKLDPKALEKLRGTVEQTVAEREAALDPRKRFGKYLLIREIGRGGSGVVHQAMQEELNRTVALKILHSDDERAVQRFTREAQTAAKLSHPSIVPIYEVGCVADRHYIAMEFVAGTTLDGLRPGPEKAAAFMIEAADAVQVAHEQGIIHRDLKPQNIMTGDDGRVRVMDFGLAREVRPGTTFTVTGAILGTPHYMSPEQAEGKRCDERSDVYSLGATLYELLAGRPPFEGETVVEILDRVRRDDAVPLRRRDSRIPWELETVVLKALEKDPARRYPSAKAFAGDLCRWRDGEPIEARPISAVSRLWRKGRKHRTVVIPVAIAATLALVFGAWALRETGQGKARAEALRLVMDAGERSDRGDHDAALALYSKAIETDPSFALAWQNRGIAWIRKRDYEKAVADLDAAIGRDPALSVAFQNRASAWFYRKDVDRAIADASRAIELDPKDSVAFYIRAAAWLNKERFDRSVADGMEAVRLDPRFTDALANLGLARLRGGDAKGAVPDLERTLVIAPPDWPHRAQIEQFLQTARAKAEREF